MTRTNAEALRQITHRSPIERPRADQAHGAVHRCARALPGRTERGGLGPAAQARPKAGSFRSSRARKEAHVLGARGVHRANGTAIDLGCANAGEEAPVIRAVAGHARSVAF